MKKKIGIISVTLLIAFVTVGCSSTQPIAAAAMDAGLKHQDKVFVNMTDKYCQAVLNEGSERAKTDGPAAVKYTFDEMNDVAWLKVQWERGRTLLRTPQEYIWGQKPFFKIVMDEWKAAEQEVEAKTPAAPVP